MIELTESARSGLRNGLLATGTAMGAFQQACQDLLEMPAAQPIDSHLGLLVARLEAMRGDLRSRLAVGSSQDALFIGLNLLEAGLSSLTDSVGEMREACIHVQPRERQRGWFLEP